MKVTRDVILDLLPVYLAGEASQDTQTLVEEYLETDPQLAQLAQQAGQVGLPNDIPIPLKEEDEMKAFKKAKRLLFQHNMFLALAVVFTFLFAIGMTVLLDENPIGPAIFFALAGIFWAAYFIVNRQLSD